MMLRWGPVLYAVGIQLKEDSSRSVGNVSLYSTTFDVPDNWTLDQCIEKYPKPTDFVM